MIKWEKHRNVRNTTSGGSLQTDAGTADDFGMADALLVEHSTFGGNIKCNKRTCNLLATVAL